ncbi:MAG: NlpC/P60 family protein [Bryobacteraceae bacterium]|nr:NlpC/P60 family protein [Bryobacteraceae bacterium]MCX7604415.1 NlpC/P60 family protein [Bryobacteraceae bacterium]
MRVLPAALMLLLSSASAQTRAVVTVPVLDMFSRASDEADVVSQARYGMTVRVEQADGAWARIRTLHDDYPGWARLSAMRLLAEGESYAEKGRVAFVDSLRAHLYRTPSVTRHAPLLTVPYETRLEVLEEPEKDERRWIRVRLPDAREAWIQRGDVLFDPPPLSVAGLVELSKRFLGLPYTWGGTTSFGFDCSGFTQMLVRRGGVLMPRDAQPQADWEGMRKIAREELEPGDLVFFGPSSGKINHTGFYLGGGEFIHSTTNTRPVLQISRLDEEPWNRLLVACRRWRRP